MTSRRYKKLSQNENGEEMEAPHTTIEEDDINEESKKQTAEKLEQISIKIHALLWVLGAVSLGYYLDIIIIVIYNQKLQRYFL